MRGMAFLEWFAPCAGARGILATRVWNRVALPVIWHVGDFKSAEANGTDYSGPGMKEAVGALIFLALIGSHLTMWMRCKRP